VCLSEILEIISIKDFIKFFGKKVDPLFYIIRLLIHTECLETFNYFIGFLKDNDDVQTVFEFKFDHPSYNSQVLNNLSLIYLEKENNYCDC